MRADARRNYERLVTVAREAIAEQGVDVPLDQIAKSAGVGAGTLYRHFPTRNDLLEAVFRDRMTTIERAALDLVDHASPDEALTRWIELVLEYATTNRGLSEAVMQCAEEKSVCRTTMTTAAAAVLERAQKAGVARPDLEVGDLVTLVNALSVAVQNRPGDVGRLLRVLMEGVRAR